MKRGVACLTALWLTCTGWCADALLPAEVREAPVETDLRILAVTRDSAGAIWGISPDKAGTIFRRGPKSWEPMSVPVPETFHPKAIETAPNGSVVCLWLSSDGPEGAVSRHAHKEAPPVVRFATKLREPQLFAGAEDNVVVTERGPAVVVANLVARSVHVWTLPEELFRPAKRGDAQERSYAPTRVSQDKAGRLWFWSYALDASDYQWRVAGLAFMQENGQFERAAAKNLSPDDRLSAVLPTGPQELWLAKVGDGLWSLDAATGQAAPLPESFFAKVPRKAFRYVEGFREIDGTRFVVTCPRPTAFESAGENTPRIAGRVALSIRYFYDQARRTGALFCLRDGVWQEVLDGLDESPRFGNWQRPWGSNADALLVGATGSGPWVISRTDAARPMLLDWKQRFPLPEAADFALGSATEILSVSSSGATALSRSTPNPQRPIRQVEIVKVHGHLWRDTRGHLWAGSNPLQEWNGRKWIAHSLPDEADPQSGWEWLADDRDRGWMLFGSGKVAVYDFATSRWQAFTDVESALQAQLPDGILLPHSAEPFLDPAFGRDGRCAFFRLPDRLSYFDGNAWNHWTTTEVAGESVEVQGGPYFDEGRNLCFPLGGKIYQWDAAERKWLSYSAPLRPPPSTRPAELSTEISTASAVVNPASVARDVHGTEWIVTSDGKLVKQAPGMLVPAFLSDEAHPFRDGMKVARALIDATGNAWLELADFGELRRYVFVQALAIPDTTAELLQAEAATATLRFTAKGGAKDDPLSPSFFSWRLDEGPWQRLSQDSRMTLKHLSAGRHRVEVRAYGPNLDVDPTPAVVEWETSIDPAQQNRALLAELSAPTVARREAAAKAFREQGMTAEKFLREARATAPETARWWIDAILQEISAKP